ncbi:phage tail protein [Bradyrhizobium sp. CCBAU 53415]|uniref:phage tail protein n=1 Tax=Bradyrhizobium sp. CCBAU 53415 TaxID=1325119 RepID=UPI0023058844|nr:tail fiber protein [Bradyrhizobium sp. CCBAU 53415]MDA9463688.1 tail protein [Bradyrhizobium sp. CCBAU 53415]
MTLYKWSQTASADATADSTINWAEGQAPSSVNDSARAMMAAIAKYRDDVAGAIVTTGTSTAYAANTYQVFQSVSQLNGQVIAFTPHATNGATVTLNVDGLGAKPLWSAPSVELPAGVLVQGTPYAALYNASDAAFYLHGFFNSPYSIPIGASVDFWGASAPNSSFVLAYGQAISRTTYSTLFSMFSTTYGSGDGSTTFNVPDLRGRVIAGKDDMGGINAFRLTSTYLGSAADQLGSVGGSQSHTLTSSEMPSHNHTLTDPGHGHSIAPAIFRGLAASNAGSFGFPNGSTATGDLSLATATTGISLANTGGGAAHAIVQPTIIANKLLRVI